MTMTVKPPFPPRLADGVELLGEFKDSGYRNPPSLVRRPDGQVIQLSRLLYLVLRRLDGFRDPVVVADLVSDDVGRTLSPGLICYVIVAKLAPLGIIDGHRTAAADSATAAPLLSLRGRGTLLPPRAAGFAGGLLRPLFYRPVIAAVLLGVVAVDFWVFSIHGLSDAFGQLMNDPADLLLLALLMIASAVFHECGHAAGCRYGGATPGRIGFGLYLVWPSFFTDVTDSYRLDRAGRLRTDLGGVYFNLIFILGMAGLFSVTSAQILLLVIVLSHLEVLQQLLPFVRFDGYFILTDLVGVPDLFRRVTPTLRDSRAQAAAGGLGAAPLQRRAQKIATCWALCTIPILVLTMGYLLLHLPEMNRALWLSARQSGGQTLTAFTHHQYVKVAVDAIGALLASVSTAGSLYIATGLARRAVASGRNWSAGRPDRRQVAVVAGAGFLVCLVSIWVAQGQFNGW